jgi:hypothetical protein
MAMTDAKRFSTGQASAKACHIVDGEDKEE